MATKSISTSAKLSAEIVVWDYSSEPTIVIPAISTQTKQPDAQAKKCHELMKIIDTFFQNKFSICVVKNEWNTMTACIHNRNQTGEAGSKIPSQWYSNAAWFGDVDPKFFKHPPAYNLDIVAHEFGHALTQYYGRLGSKGQSGALIESISDVVAIAIKHDCNMMSADNPQANWLIADGFLVNKPEDGTAIRSMSDPGKAFKNHPTLGKDKQVAHFKHYIQKEAYEHENAGIPNRAFYLAATKIGGPTWKTAQIWFEALKRTNNDDFKTFAASTVQAAKDLNRSPDACNIIEKAWAAVGIDLQEPTLLTRRNFMIAGGVALLGVVCAVFVRKK